MLITFRRIIKSGWTGFKRNSGFSLATIFIMVMMTSVVTFLFVFQEATKLLVEDIQGKVDMSVYLNRDLSADEIMTIKTELAKVPEIKSLEYVSKDEALQKFTSKHQNDSVIMESLQEVGDNPLLASLNITAFDANQYESIANFIASSSFAGEVAKMDYSQKKPTIDKLFSITNTINKTGIVASAILALIVVVIAFNTARLAIYNSKTEIETMKLVGASNWFIRGPFLIQGAICGFFAALITFVLFFAAIYFAAPKVEVVAPGLNLFSYFVSNIFIILFLQLAAGLGLGVLSSWLAVRKYLKI